MKRFNLPNMQSGFKTICTYVLDGKPYTFQFTWCDTFFLMDIYVFNSGNNEYLLKGAPVVINCDLLSRIIQPNLIQGKLYMVNKFDEDYPPSPDTISTDFELIYYSADE